MEGLLEFGLNPNLKMFFFCFFFSSAVLSISPCKTHLVWLEVLNLRFIHSPHPKVFSKCFLLKVYVAPIATKIKFLFL